MLVGTSLLTLAVTLTAIAAAPEAPWGFQDIGQPALPGATDFDPGTSIWSIQSSGTRIYRCGRCVSLRLPAGGRRCRDHGAHPQYPGRHRQVSDGADDRESLNPGSPNVNLAMTGGGLQASSRFVPEPKATVSPASDLASFGRTTSSSGCNASVRRSPASSSRDGRLWRQTGFSPQTLSSLPHEALLGLAVTSDYSSQITTAALEFSPPPARTDRTFAVWYPGERRGIEGHLQACIRPARWASVWLAVPAVPA